MARFGRRGRIGHHHHHGGRRGPPRVFPTHDPEGYPLPDANCQWPIAFMFSLFGLIILIAGSVMMAQAKARDRDWETLTGRTSLSSGNSFIGMIAAGAVLFALGCGCAFGCRYRNQQKYADWAMANPDAARVFEAKGGFDAVPYIIHPDYQAQAQPTTVQVIVVQPNGAPPAGPPGYTYPTQPAGAPIVQNGALVYPQAPQPLEQPPQQQAMAMVAATAATGNTYFYKPEFRGQRLTPEQMAGATTTVVMQQQAQPATMLMVQPGAVMGQPVGGDGAFKPPEHFSYAQGVPPTPAASGIPGFGLPSM